jgi:glycosyltransferase involved in cell wall biosynthesis
MSNAAIYFHPDGYNTNRSKLMGRQAAGEGFLRGFLKFAAIDHLYAYIDHPDHGKVFEDFVQKSGMKNTNLPISTISIGNLLDLSAAGSIFVPGPGLDDFAWRRRRDNQRGFSITGVTHTTASFNAMDAIGSLLTAPVQDWDALICTSQSVRKTVDLLLNDHEEYLAARFGSTATIQRPQLPVIPLGVECDLFDHPADQKAALRKKWRDKLGIAANDWVVLFVGRLSFHAKAHPLPMLMGLELAAQELGEKAPKIHLIEAGWYANDGIKDAFDEAHQKLSPSITVHDVDGRRPDARYEIWHCADIFCSMSDNIQETFGLTPIEAMAAGLPVIASDWDGYRETILDGKTGILVPTTLPPIDLGQFYARLHEDELLTYDRYCGETCLSTAVDIRASRDAFVRLFTDAEIRLQMGENGRRRAREVYDWSVIISAYQDLWRDLAARREKSPEIAPRVTATSPANPLRGNPFHLFAHYPTIQMDDNSVLVKTNLNSDLIRQACALKMTNITGSYTRGSQLAQWIYNLIGRDATGLTLGKIIAGAKNDYRTSQGISPGREQCLIAIGWLCKMGALEVQ